MNNLNEYLSKLDVENQNGKNKIDWDWQNKTTKQ